MVTSVVEAAPSTADMIQFELLSLVILLAIILLPIFVVFLIWRAARQGAQDRKAAQAKQLAEQSATESFLKSYSGWTDYACSPFDRSFIAIDISGQRIALGFVGNATVYPFDAITDIEVVRDGGTLTTHQVAPSAPVMGTAYFEEQALLKAIESPTSTIRTISDLTLKLTVNDVRTPIYDVNFLHTAAPSGLPVTDGAVIDAVKRLDEFRGHVANALRARQTSAPAADTAGQLAKLWDLRQAGALTDEEYANQKAKLLSG